MTSLTEGRLRFDFPDDWRVEKFDELGFYRGRFLKLSSGATACEKCDARLRCGACKADRPDGAKGVDFLAVDASGGVGWLIEVKDYCNTLRTDLLFLADEVAAKVRNTLACVVAMKRADDPRERDLAAATLRCDDYRVVLHLEEPPGTAARRRVHPANSRLANVQNKLQTRLAPVDRRAEAVGLSRPGGKAWSVTDIG